jgi:hypothetical protein
VLDRTARGGGAKVAFGACPAVAPSRGRVEGRSWTATRCFCGFGWVLWRRALRAQSGGYVASWPLAPPAARRATPSRHVEAAVPHQTSELPLLPEDCGADRRPVRRRFIAVFVPVCLVIASCGGAGSGAGPSVGRGWVRVADAICARQNSAIRDDWTELERQSAHGTKPQTVLIQLYSRVAAQSKAMSDALRANVDAPRGSLPYNLVASSAIAAEGWREKAAATRTGDATRLHEAIVKTSDGTVSFLLLASVAHMHACTDDTETAARSTPEQRTAFQASSDATWLCETHADKVPSIYRSIIESDLRELVALEHSSPRERVTFVAHIHPSFTYRALAKDAADALGSPGCADDPTLTSLRTQFDPVQSTSTPATPT